MSEKLEVGDGNIPVRETLNYLGRKFHPTIEKCPGCLYNCYIMEEGIQLRSLRDLVFLLLEIPTLIQMAKIKTNRKKPL